MRVEALFEGEWLVACDSDVECVPTPTPTGTLTPTATLSAGSLPDLLITSARVSMQGYSGGCVTRFGPLETFICVSNQGAAPAGPFVIRDTGGGSLAWQVEGLDAGEERCLQSVGVASVVTVDADDEVVESDEANNTQYIPVPTPPAICTPTATATTTAATCGIAGTVTMQGRNDHGGIAVHVDGVPLATTDVDGRFSLDSLLPGMHQVRASHLGYLSRVDNATPCQAGEVTQMPATTLLGGNANNDQQVNLFDLVIVGASFRTCAGDDRFRLEADVNATGCVDIFDLVLVGTNYGRTGPMDWSTAMSLVRGVWRMKAIDRNLPLCF